MFYRGLLMLYPRPFQERFGSSMMQTLNDLCYERQGEGGARWVGFIVWLFTETVVGIVKERILQMQQGGMMKAVIANPKPAALISLLFTLPFILLNAIAINRIEPLFTIFQINTGGAFWDYPIGHSTALIALLLLPCGAIIALRPMLQVSADGKRKFYWMNAFLTVLLLAAFVLIASALIEEIYRCNVLQVPNCD